MKIVEVSTNRFRVTIETGPGDEVQVMLDRWCIEELVGLLAGALGYRVSTERPDYGTPPTETDQQTAQVINSLMSGVSKWTAVAQGRPVPADVQDAPLPRRNRVARQDLPPVMPQCCNGAGSRGPDDHELWCHTRAQPDEGVEDAYTDGFSEPPAGAGRWWRALRSPAPIPTEAEPTPAEKLDTELDRIRALYKDGETP